MKNYLALGDSYTIGEAVAYDENFPMQFVKMLRQQGFAFADPLILAKTGWTTDELLLAIQQESIVQTFDLVTLLIGVNNQYRGYSLQAYHAEFKTLLEQSIRFANDISQNVCVLSIPDWSVMPFAEGQDRAEIAYQIDVFNDINRSETQRQGAFYVDITDISRCAFSDVALVAQDGLHPSAKMYQLWVERMLHTAQYQ